MPGTCTFERSGDVWTQTGACPINVYTECPEIPNSKENANAPIRHPQLEGNFLAAFRKYLNNSTFAFLADDEMILDCEGDPTIANKRFSYLRKGVSPNGVLFTGTLKYLPGQAPTVVP